MIEAETKQQPHLKRILLFALPLMLTGVLQTLYNAVDLMVIGRFEGEVALAAVGSTGSLTNLILGLFMGLSVGAGVCVAHAIGAGDHEDVQKSLHTSILIALLLGAFVSVIGFFLAPQLLTLMGTPDDVIEDASLYIRIIFIGAPASILYNYVAAMLRASGDSKRPLLFLTVAGIINVLLNLLLVVVFRIGVAGVAIGTIASQAVSAIMALLHLMRTKGPLHLSFRKLSINKSKLKKVLHIGIPSGVQGTLFSLSNVILQSSINSFGSVVIAGSAAAANVEGIYYVIYRAFYDGTLTFVGQSVGAKKFGDIKRIVGAAIIDTLLTGTVMSTTGLLFGEYMLKLYIPDNQEVLAAASVRFNMLIIPYFLCGIMDIMSGTLRGMGKSISSAIISLIFACGFRIVWISTVFKVFTTPRAIYITYPLSWILTAAVGAIFVIITVKKENRKHLSSELIE
ncbi:MAG: MATE family efflux transporter [Ruminococcaceae bacterium]|nr:MATE family efflux transporter [Oscillospiraceae bacterium]